MRIFWFSLPFFLFTSIIGILYFPSLPLKIAIVVLLALFAGALFFVSQKTARFHASLAVLNAEFGNMTASFEDALVSYDKNFTIIFMNAAAEKLFGVRAEIFVGRSIEPRDAQKPELRVFVEVLYPSLAPTFVSRSPIGTYPQIADVSFSDPALELRVTTASLTDDAGLPVGFMKIIRDRTQEVALARSKNEFVSIVSHQLRTPLTEIHWALQALAADPGLSPDTQKILQGTLHSAESLLDVVEDLLNVSRIEEGRFGYTFESIDLASYLGEILGAALPQAERANLKLYFDRPKEPLSSVLIDRQKLSMALSNLLDNSIRYNIENGQITVRVRKAETAPFLEVSVKDTGVGIPAEEIGKLFERFFRASNVKKFNTDGSGLGLYIAKRIIEAHGGKIWAESELNRGTTIFFTLPTDPTLVPVKEVTSEL